MLASAASRAPAGLLRQVAGALRSLTTVLSFGVGQQGALGIRSTADQHEPEEIPDLPKNIAAVGAGHFCSFAATDDGQLYSWGRNREGQLGRGLRGDEFGSSAAPAPVDALSRQHVVAATGSGVASFALCADGSLWAFGSSKRGQLGQGPGVLHTTDPQQVHLPAAAVQVSAGWGHAAALLEDGSVWTWGWAASGRLGHSFAASDADEEEQRLLERCVWQPRQVEVLRGVRAKQVACGFDHTMVLAEDGTLFSFGDNSLCQLGRPQQAQGEHRAPQAADGWAVNPPAAGSRRPRFLRVAAGLGHCLGVMADGTVTAWGWNSAGQCGLGQFVTAECVAQPTPVYGLPANRNALVAAGRVHSLLVTDEIHAPPPHGSYALGGGSAVGSSSSSSSGGGGNGTSGSGQPALTMAFSWGSADGGRLGSGHFESAAHPEMIAEVDGEEMLGVACGLDHTLVLIRTRE